MEAARPYLPLARRWRLALPIALCGERAAASLHPGLAARECSEAGHEVRKKVILKIFI
jgi:hypothetical protein